MIFLKKPDPIDSREIDCLIYETINGGTVARRSDGVNTLSANILIGDTEVDPVPFYTKDPLESLMMAKTIMSNSEIAYAICKAMLSKLNEPAKF